MTITVQRLGETFVAAVEGLDAADPMDEATWAAFYDAYLEHQVLVLRDQPLTARQFHDFGARFGSIEPHTVEMYHHEEFPGITILSNRVELGRPKGIRDAGSEWHSDYSYKATAANATMLHALEIPDVGGDTYFADMAAAYEVMPAELKARVEERKVRQQYRWTRDRTHPENRWNLLSEAERDLTPEVVHPLVRTHPEVDRKGLFVTPALTSGNKEVIGLDEAAGMALLDEVFEHATQPRFQFRHQWRTGDLVLWDNRTLMHHATTDILPPEKHRTLHRINTQGSVPY